MEDSLHYRLRTCHTNCQKAIIHHIKQTTELRPGEPKILEFLAEHEPCEQKEIAAGCGLDSASVTGILGRMESRGLVERKMKPGNRRSLYVTMTEHGKTLHEEVEKTFYLVDQAAEKGLTQPEKEEFTRLLQLVNQNLIELLEEQKENEFMTSKEK